jgi:hypothetical protein
MIYPSPFCREALIKAIIPALMGLGNEGQALVISDNSENKFWGDSIF